MSLGALTAIIIEAVKPPIDVRFWRTIVVLLGPIGLTYLILGSIRNARDRLRRGSGGV